MKTLKLTPLLAALAFVSSTWAGVPPEVEMLSRDWAKIKYETPPAGRKAAFEALAQRSAGLTEAHPGQAEYLVWEGIIVASAAGEQGGVGLAALGMVKKAKDLLDRAEKIDPEVLDGSVYTSLGSLYYQVPGWPIGFGDDEKARAYLEKALTLNPDGIDPNYFYGDFLMRQKDYAGAITAFDHALAAVPRPNRPVADAGRRKEIQALLAEARKKQE